MQNNLLDIDLELQELLESFICELPDRLAAIESACERGDNNKLIMLVHQLAGAGGSYGFPDLSHAATAYEAALRHVEEQSVQQTAHHKLFQACEKAIASGAAGSMLNAI